MSEKKRDEKFGLPYFDLAKLRSFSLDALLKAENQDLAKLMIALSIVYNDFKDYAWFKEIFDDELKEIDESKKTGILGQLNGMREHCFRMFIAHFLELLKLLNKHKTLFDTKEFKNILHYLRKIDADMPGNWWTLVRLAESDTSDDKFHNTLIKIRNNGTYHYKDTKCLYQGLEYYIEKQGTEGYISLGDSLLETRFYFGDATIQFFHRKTTDEFGTGTEDFVKTLDEYLEKVNKLLRFIVEIYLTKILKVV